MGASSLIENVYFRFANPSFKLRSEHKNDEERFRRKVSSMHRKSSFPIAYNAPAARHDSSHQSVAYHKNGSLIQKVGKGCSRIADSQFRCPPEKGFFGPTSIA